VASKRVSNVSGVQRRANLMYFTPKQRAREELPSEDIVISDPPPPPQPYSPPNMTFALITPIVGLVSATGVLLTSGSLLAAAPMLVMALVYPSMMFMQSRSGKKRYQKQLADYNAKNQARLDQVAEIIRDTVTRQRDIMNRENPTLDLMVLEAKKQDRNENVNVKRLWTRFPNEDDFLSVRVGAGRVPTSFSVHSPSRDDESEYFQQAKRLREMNDEVPDAPITVNLKGIQVLSITSKGPKANATGLAYTLLGNIAAHHSPQFAQIYFLSHKSDAATRWDWLKWLPHTKSLTNNGDEGQISFTPERTEKALGRLKEIIRQRTTRTGDTNISARNFAHLIVVLDRIPEAVAHTVIQDLLKADEKLGTTLIFLEDTPPPTSNVRATLALNSSDDRSGSAFSYVVSGASAAQQLQFQGRAEISSRGQCEDLARSLASIRGGGSAGVEIPRAVSICSLLGGQGPDEIDFDKLYARYSEEDNFLDFPIGQMGDSKPLRMRLRENARMSPPGSPHAILAGTTGSGKSVLLRSIVLSLAATHSPKSVNILLADFKGGDLLALRHLPHIAGYISNLNAGMAERCRMALENELNRRASIIGEDKNIWTYNRHHFGQEMPDLVVILDEFARAMKLNEGFRKTIDSVGALGRALGIHLILGTQRAEDFDERLRALIGYRICLRVENRNDSVNMLRKPDAFSISRSLPGRGYLQLGNDELYEQFQSALSDNIYIGSGARQRQFEAFAVAEVLADGARGDLYEITQDDILSEAADAGDSSQPHLSEGDMLVQRIIDYCSLKQYQPATPVYTEPLPSTEDELRTSMPLGSLANREEMFRGWTDQAWWSQPVNPHNRLRVPVGKVDIPARVIQMPWYVDLAESGGHFWVVGTADSGKEMFLRTLILSLAMSHSPEDLHVYLLDLGTQALQEFERLPHCNGNVFLPSERERVNRLLSYLRNEVGRRQELLNRARVSTPEDLRQSFPDLALPSIVLVINNYSQFKTDFEDKQPTITHLVSNGRRVDIHVIFSTDRSNHLPGDIKGNVENRLALRVGAIEEYRDILNTNIRAGFSPDVEGRGYVRWTDVIAECQVAWPTIQDGFDHNDQPLSTTIDAMNNAWTSSRPMMIGDLPTHIALNELLDRDAAQASITTSQTTLPLGLDYDLVPVSVNLANFGPFFFVLGQQRSGKTELLVTLCLSLAPLTAVRQIDIAIADFHDLPSHLSFLNGQPGIAYAHGAQAETMLTDYVSDLSRKADAARAAAQAAGSSGALARLPQSLLIIDGLAGLLRMKPELLKQLNECADSRTESRLFMILTANRKQDVLSARSHIFVDLAVKDGCVISLSPDLNEFDTTWASLSLPIKARIQQMYSARVIRGRGFMVNNHDPETMPEGWRLFQAATVAPAEQVSGEKDAINAVLEAAKQEVERSTEDAYQHNIDRVVSLALKKLQSDNTLA